MLWIIAALLALLTILNSLQLHLLLRETRVIRDRQAQTDEWQRVALKVANEALQGIYFNTKH